MPRSGLLLVTFALACHPPGRIGPAPEEVNGVAIRVNQLGYLPGAPKVAVACALAPRVIGSFRVVDRQDRTVAGPSRHRALSAVRAGKRMDFEGAAHHRAG